MEKIIKGIEPGKSYVVRFRPSGTSVWSSSYEFTAPDQNAAETVAENKVPSQVVTSVKLNSSKTWSATNPSHVAWDSAVSNSYGAWKSSDNTKIKCLSDGWYQATFHAVLATDSVSYQGTSYGGFISHFTSGGVETKLSMDMRDTTPDDSYFIALNITTVPVYCKAGEYFKAYVYVTGWSGMKGKILTTYAGSSTPPSRFSLWYIGP